MKNLRLSTYAGALVIVVLAFLATLNILTFDQTTGIVDIKPFNLYSFISPVTGVAATVVSTVVALLANLNRWRT